MITYVGLMSFTDKGIAGIKDTTKRAVAAREVAKKFGVTFRELLWTMGKYDAVCVLEAEDEQALAAFNLATAMQGTCDHIRSARTRPTRLTRFWPDCPRT